LEEFIHLVFGVKRTENVIHIPAKYVRGASILLTLSINQFINTYFAGMWMTHTLPHALPVCVYFASHTLAVCVYFASHTLPVCGWHSVRLTPKTMDKFFQNLNKLYSSVSFSKEVEADGHLTYLDVLLTKNEKRIETTIYRKNTHTGL